MIDHRQLTLCCAVHRELDPPFPLSTILTQAPVVLVATAAVAALAIAAGVLSWALHPDPAPGPVAQSAASPIAAPTTEASNPNGITARTNTIAAVRTAPGSYTQVLGTLGRNESVEVIGRSAAASWLRIVFPPGSSLHGWIAAAMLDVTGDVNTLAVATAEPPVVIVPPAGSSSRTPVRPTGSATAVSAAATATLSVLLPDLVLAQAHMGRTTLVTTIENQGDGPTNGIIVVSVFAADGRTQLATTTAPNTGLAPHASLEVDTGYVVHGSQRLVVVVNPAGTIKESNAGNNSTTVAVVGG
jgi:SH3 domain-containing protein/CARDB protein